MKQTIKLSLIYFKEQLFSAFQSFGKRSKTKTLPTIIFMFLFLAFAIGYSLYNIADSLSVLGLSKYILIYGFFMALFMTLMITLSDTQGVMYKSKDYNLLSSLPIKNISIITAKYLGNYLTTMLYFLIIALPTYVVYFIFNEVTAFAVILGILAILFMPAFSQFITSIIGFIVNAISAKMKNKNLIRTIFTLIFAVGLAVFISLSNSDLMTNLFTNGLPLWFKIVFSNIYFLFVSITTTSFVNYIYAILVSLVFMALGILIISLGYKKINSALMVTKVKNKPSPIVYKNKSVFANLFKKEITTFFSSPVYCVNGLMGLIMSVVCTIICVTTFFEISITEPIVKDIFAAIMAYCVAMCLGIAPTTSVTISMEGGKLQNLKSMPVKFKDICLSKCALNLMLYLPVAIVCPIIFGVVLKVPFLLCMLILIYLILAMLSYTLLGFLLNLKFPRLNWSSETQAVKGGASMLLTMFLDLIISIIPMVVFLVWLSYSTYLTFTIFMPVVIGLELIYVIALIIVLIKKGEKIFNAIQV